MAHVCACVRTLFFSNSEKLTDNLLNVSTLPNNKEKQKVVLFLSNFFFFFFFLSKFGYKICYSLRLQLLSNLIFFFIKYEFWQIQHWIIFYYYILHTCKIFKISKINNYVSLKLYIKNKFIDHIVNNIILAWNLTSMLRI